MIKLNKCGFKLLTLAAILAGVIITKSDDAVDPPAAQSGRVPYDRLLDEVNSLSGFLWELAAERYSAVSKRGEVWILTVHDGWNIRKFKDKKYTVVSLPAVQPINKIGLCRYAAQYNALNEQAADQMVKNGRYKDARELYQLVLRFHCPDEAPKEQVEQKLSILDKLEKGQNVEANLKEFGELTLELGSLLDLSGIDRIQPKEVTNLLNLRLR